MLSAELPGLRLVKIDKSNVKNLRLLNASILPIHYSTKFYQTVLQNPDLSRLALWNEKYVGMVCCKIENGVLYIMTLGCLVMYRRKKIGTSLLNFVLELSRSENCCSIQLHVHSSNDEAVQFYEKFGFRVKETLENYYRYLKPTTGLFLERSMLLDCDEKESNPNKK
ncbi:hypothetical protein ACHWQZ_G014962 [Mnemiopsis leidyi]